MKQHMYYLIKILTAFLFFIEKKLFFDFIDDSTSFIVSKDCFSIPPHLCYVYSYIWLGNLISLEGCKLHQRDHQINMVLDLIYVVYIDGHCFKLLSSVIQDDDDAGR